MEIETEAKLKKVHNPSDLEKLIPGDKVKIHLCDKKVISEIYTYEGKKGDKYGFMESFNFYGAPVEVRRNTLEGIKFNEGNLIISAKNWKIYTIGGDLKEYNKRRKLMGLEEYK